MRHRVKGRKLGRDTSHRNALRKNMIADLICHEQITTTEGKARMLRPAAEKIITIAKRGLAKGADDPARAVDVEFVPRRGCTDAYIAVTVDLHSRRFV